MREDISGLTVLVVDDVFTTGATIDAAAACLKAAGRKKCFLLLFASEECKEIAEKTLFIGKDICYNNMNEFFYEESGMINEEKIKVMTKIAMYEQGEGRKYLPISKYYRSDYIGLALIKNFFLVTLVICS